MAMVIHAEGISKQYRIGARERYKSLRESIMRGARASLRSSPANTTRTFWALRDVSFEVARGKALGVIGRNGAGKSTLLKILARITEPTEGRAEIEGRVGSLLEVGTGFHPELTGRENTFLNGAILGMRRNEIARKFDEIVGFAGVEKFVDTPVKHYSTGMYLRLAFAVAAHLETEILLVDEVLAVGDAAFQQKCMGKMGELSSGGRTVLFVSHNMAAVESLCDQALLLRAGRAESFSDVRRAISLYQSETISTTEPLTHRTDRQGDGSLLVSILRAHPEGGRPGEPVRAGDDVVFEVGIDNKSAGPIAAVEVSIGIYDFLGRAMTFLQNEPLGVSLQVEEAGPIVFRCRVPHLCLLPGDYSMNVHVQAGGRVTDWVQHAGSLTVHEGDYFGTGKVTFSKLGGVLVDQEWDRKGPGM